MTSTLPNDNIKNFDDQITNKLISEIIRDRIKNSGTDLTLMIILQILLILEN